jgi:hypothetical protein
MKNLRKKSKELIDDYTDAEYIASADDDADDDDDTSDEESKRV